MFGLDGLVTNVFGGNEGDDNSVHDTTATAATSSNQEAEAEEEKPTKPAAKKKKTPKEKDAATVSDTPQEPQPQHNGPLKHLKNKLTRNKGENSDGAPAETAKEKGGKLKELKNKLTRGKSSGTPEEPPPATTETDDKKKESSKKKSTEEKEKKKSTEEEELKSPKTPKGKKSSKKKRKPKGKSEASSPRSMENSEDSQEDVHKLLEDMEIPDFSMSMQLSGEDTTELQKGAEAAERTIVPHDQIDWSKRLKREEVFSKRYKPSKEETKELQALADHLGLASPNGLVGMGMKLLASQASENANTLFYGNHSIILKRGPVSWDGNDCELVLLTDGFVLTYRNVSGYNPLEKRYETCHLWTEVDYCERTSPVTVVIQLQAGDRYELNSVDGGDSPSKLLRSLETVIIRHAEHGNSSDTKSFGWQYKLIRKPGYTAAVTGDLKTLGNCKDLNTLDRFHGYAPLHYAVQQDECSADVIQALLHAGADPNLPDGDGRSSMYYAERNKLAEVKEILEGFGGTTSKLAEMEMRGELFGGVEGAHEKNEQRRERVRAVKENEQAMKDQKAAEAAAKAGTAQSEMSKAMAALVQRGEKINQLGEKTTELNAEAKNFGELAAQLKNEVKNKKWYQL